MAIETYKHGGWIIEKYYSRHLCSERKFIRCSHCNSVIDCNRTNIDENEFDYCPYCGKLVGTEVLYGYL